MRPRIALLFICLIGLIGCLPAQEPVAVTRPVVVTALPTEVSTAVPPTHTPPPIATQAAAATATPTTTPLPTSTPEPAWPTTPILFVRDGTLQRWLPQTNKLELLVQDIDSNPLYAQNTVVFMREMTPEKEYALIVFYTTSQTEVELFRLTEMGILIPQTGGLRLFPLLSNAIYLSPNGRWLAYVLQNKATGVFTLFAREIQRPNQEDITNQVLFSRELPMGFDRPFDITWPTENELSWIEPSGIWIANLETTPITIELEILASTNTVLVPPMNPEEQDKGPIPFQTIYIPDQWSPDGRYLLAIEHFPGELGDVFQIIERDTNLAFQLPDSSLGPLSDNAVWLDETRILHYKMEGWVRIWKVPAKGEQIFTLESEFHAAPPSETLFQVTNLFPLPTNHVRLEDPFSGIIYDLDLTMQKLAVIENNEANYDRYFWSPDGQHAMGIIYNNQNNEQLRPVNLIFLDEKLSVDMSQIFGLDSCCWYWESSGSE